MNIILLSGGSGTRLWPLSTERRSKQFIRLFHDEAGRPISMLQQVWGRLADRGLHQSAVLATSLHQREAILEQLGYEADLVLEPEKRDTLAAILLSVAYLCSHRGVSREDPIVVLPVDGRTEDSFYDRLLQLPETLASSGANLALMGVRPDFPSQKYGYMLPVRDGGEDAALTIRAFHEKPSKTDAVRYIEQGALWNCGVFCFRAGYLLDRLKAMGLPEAYEELLLSYDRIESRSFDYAVVEREERIVALAYEGRWKDLGTWCALTEEMNRPLVGPGYIGEECDNVHVVNELEMPAVVLGLSDVVVSASPEGILVTHKESSSRLKAALDRMERSGASDKKAPAEQTLDRSAFPDGTAVTTRRIHLEAGEELVTPSADVRRIVSWTVLHGRCRLFQNGRELPAAVGRSVVLGEEDNARLKALDPLDLIEIMMECHA
ncbi:mannose-1-phosphate guanylyltransferase [Paenibacillus tianmuensis]|uniref:Mannose-1-phosphate guanylyltransferase n=1 Tax=Paenibacillus tianmuensis TaxID=624147 RepID=A0A1G4TET9_9BACL|nr:sugar phosphate nucleotidyltransferase [Paenibacillus tianmuensis]SCW79930.1 mannose-1-phosphate guanylyltransferase [Paenibacillus tianmuensis]